MESTHETRHGGRLTYIKLDRLPDEKTKGIVPGQSYLKITGMGQVIEMDGVLYLEIPKWRAERY